MSESRWIEHERKVWEPTERWIDIFNKFPEADPLSDSDRECSMLPLDDLHLEERLFQPRQFTYNRADSDRQIANLCKAIKRWKGGLPRLLVWKAGGRFWVIDGHHRLIAYRKVAAVSPENRARLHDVPVLVFKGTKKEAQAQSAAANSQDQLPMKDGDKCEAAWRLVLQGTTAWSKDQIATKTKVSTSLVANMRKSIEECEADTTREIKIDPRQWTWADLKKLLKGLEEPMLQDAKDTEQVKGYVKQIQKLERKLQGPRSIRLFMKALAKVDAEVLNSAVAEGLVIRREILEAEKEAAKDQDVEGEKDPPTT